MVLNPGKCHYMLKGNHDEPDKINLNGRVIANSNNKKLLGVFIDKKLNFDVHIKTLCKKAGQKLNALAIISCYVTLDQKYGLNNSGIKSQFSYCPLIWMFGSRSLNNSLNQTL